MLNNLNRAMIIAINKVNSEQRYGIHKPEVTNGYFSYTEMPIMSTQRQNHTVEIYIDKWLELHFTVDGVDFEVYDEANTFTLKSLEHKIAAVMRRIHVAMKNNQFDRTEEDEEAEETTETAETTEKGNIDITQMMRDAGAAWVIMEMDTTYFQYGRTYRTLQSNAIERVDHRVIIYAHDPDEIQVLYSPCESHWYDWDSKIFKTLKEALEWSERYIK